MVDTDESRIITAAEAVNRTWHGPDTTARHCKYDDCPHMEKFREPRHLGTTRIGYARLKCKDCGRWSEWEEIELHGEEEE